MNLYFQNSDGNERIIANINSVDDTFKEMKKFMNEHNFNSYYTRGWEENGRIKFDVGSHTEFFYLDGVPDKEMKELGLN